MNRMEMHFDSLSDCYFKMRCTDLHLPPIDVGGDSGGGSSSSSSAQPEPMEQQQQQQQPSPDPVPIPSSLEAFGTCLSRFTHYNTFKPLATLR